MANDLFKTLGGGQTVNDGGFGDMIRQFRQFQGTFTGDARSEVQKLLQSGQMTQEQYNRLGQIATKMLNLI